MLSKCFLLLLAMISTWKRVKGSRKEDGETWKEIPPQFSVYLQGGPLDQKKHRGPRGAHSSVLPLALGCTLPGCRQPEVDRLAWRQL